MVMARNDKPTPQLPPRPLPNLPEAPGPGQPHHCPPKPDSFDAKDENGDGKLNADEFNADRGLIDKLKDPDKFDRYDADNDGYVTKKENAMGEFRDAVGEWKKSKVELPDWKPTGKFGDEPKKE